MPKNSKITQEYRNILGVNVLSTNLPQLLDNIKQKIHNKDKFLIFTPNPELVLASKDNILLKKALNAVDFNVPDGVGLKFASKFLYGKNLNIIPGRVLFQKLIEVASDNDWKVFLLGGENNESVLVAESIITYFPTIHIVTSKGARLNQKGEPATKDDQKLMDEAVKRINDFKPDLLFVAFGNPKQELWLINNLKSININGGMAVGGTFRYLAGMSKLPPQWISMLGLEWLWRLFTEPKRFGRVFNAVIMFPLAVLKNKFNK